MQGKGKGKEGSAALVNKMSQGAEVADLFFLFFLTSAYISLFRTTAGFLLASSPQQTTAVPKDLAYDCLSEQLHDDCTG